MKDTYGGPQCGPICQESVLVSTVPQHASIESIVLQCPISRVLSSRFLVVVPFLSPCPGLEAEHTNHPHSSPPLSTIQHYLVPNLIT